MFLLKHVSSLGRLSWGTLLTLDKLQRKGWSLANRCYLCKVKRRIHWSDPPSLHQDKGPLAVAFIPVWCFLGAICHSKRDSLKGLKSSSLVHFLNNLKRKELMSFSCGWRCRCYVFNRFCWLVGQSQSEWSCFCVLPYCMCLLVPVIYFPCTLMLIKFYYLPIKKKKKCWFIYYSSYAIGEKVLVSWCLFSWCTEGGLFLNSCLIPWKNLIWMYFMGCNL